MKTTTFIDKATPLLLFLGLFGLYLHTAGPSLVPYRDAGEIATSVSRLGVLHPPGYPMYTLIGRLFSQLPLANPAYRLNVLSALALAAAWGVLYLLWADLWGSLVGVLIVLLGAVSYLYWLHALVSEMYALNLLLLSALLWLLHRKRFELAALLLGVSIGVRIDLILCAPAMLILFFMQTKHEQRLALLIRCAGWFLLGASSYLYLLLRARQQPLLNWGDPSTFYRFWGSLTRRSYGGTLDLLSKSYQPGENFVSEFFLYVRHLARDFSYLGLVLAGVGGFQLWKEKRDWFWALLAGWVLTGPLFIYLGNMPPNPHAVAIMEASYLVPDVFILFTIGAGLALLRSYSNPFRIVVGLLVGILLVQVIRVYPRVNKRNNWFAVDFTRNVLMSVPEPSMIVARSDVPVFSLFYGYWIYPGYKWRLPVAQGLAPAAWYQVMMNQQVRGLDVMALSTAEDWEKTAKANVGWSLFGTSDVEWTPDLFSRMVPQGLLLKWMPRGKTTVLASDTLLSDLSVYRGIYQYDAHAPDFFAPELIEEYSKAWTGWGRLLLRSHQEDSAIPAFLHALAMKPDSPDPAFQVGFIYFQRGEYATADRYYHWCIDNFQKMDAETIRWKALPAIREDIHRNEAQALAHWGVIQERMGYPEAAQRLYLRSLGLDPECADARYNLAVIYWRAQRWGDVVEQLQSLSAAHPEDTRWRAYLPAALQHLQQEKMNHS